MLLLLLRVVQGVLVTGSLSRLDQIPKMINFISARSDNFSNRISVLLETVVAEQEHVMVGLKGVY